MPPLRPGLCTNAFERTVKNISTHVLIFNKIQTYNCYFIARFLQGRWLELKFRSAKRKMSRWNGTKSNWQTSATRYLFIPLDLGVGKTGYAKSTRYVYSSSIIFILLFLAFNHFYSIILSAYIVKTWNLLVGRPWSFLSFSNAFLLCFFSMKFQLICLAFVKILGML